jgi:hypothetical protein
MAKQGFIGDPEHRTQAPAAPNADAPGETSADLGDFIGDAEVTSGQIDTTHDSDEEEGDQNINSQGDDDSPVTPDDTDDSPGDGDGDDLEEVEFSVSQIIRAGQAGISEAQLSQYTSEAELEAAIGYMTQRAAQPQMPVQPAPAQTPAEPPKPWEPEPFSEQPPTDSMDETAMRNYHERMNAHWAKQIAEAQKQASPEITEQINALQKSLTEQQTMQFYRLCESQFEGLAEDHKDLIGSGPTEALAPGTQALMNRQAVVMEMQRQAQVHPEMSPDQLFGLAFRVALNPSISAQATKKVRKAVAKRQATASPKPSTRAGAKGAAALPKGPERVRAMLKDTSTSLGKKAAKIFKALN